MLRCKVYEYNGGYFGHGSNQLPLWWVLRVMGCEVAKLARRR